ncbi:MAG: chromosome segregation protein SMC [Candidatus Nanopelagicales bacterium]
MHLKSLTLKGFKSFASATTLAFEPGVTAVVGPNGSGKSNVVDALAWVMGEQGAKTLRGGKMEDVIFAGTSGRPPLGRAEVSLTIDNSDGALPIEYSEVTISRVMFRAGGSEYFINKQAARLLDVQELLSDSGIGREMHVIVGQGQLDAILRATPEERRGFIEEAAGVLKHRKRKERAVRKLEAMSSNLHRVQDLATELRRQLTPLGKQAEVARRANVIQTDLRDSGLRLLADDLHQLREAYAQEIADESALRERKSLVEAELAAAQAEEAAREAASQVEVPALKSAQETWYALSAVLERLRGTVGLASDRTSNLAAEPEDERRGRDPAELAADAARLREQEQSLRLACEQDRGHLSEAVSVRVAAEAALAMAEAELRAAVRAAADRREGLARLTGQVNAARTRLEARAGEIARLAEQATASRARAAAATEQFHVLEHSIAGLDEGEVGLDDDYEAAQSAVDDLDARLAEVNAAQTANERERARIGARVETLQAMLTVPDAAAELLDRPGILGTLGAAITVERGCERAVAAALGSAVDAVIAADLDTARAAIEWLGESGRGRASVLVAGWQGPDPAARPPAPAGCRYLVDSLEAAAPVTGTLAGLLHRSLIADLTPGEVAELAAAHPRLVFYTPGGDRIGRGHLTGGAQAAPSTLETAAAVQAAQTEMDARTHDAERLRFELSALAERRGASTAALDVSLSALHDSDARMAAVAEQLGHLGQQARAATGEAERVERAQAAAEQARAADAVTHAELQERLQRAQPDTAELAEPSPAERDAASAALDSARKAEMEARLALRTGEERVRAMAGRAEQLERAATAERAARERAATRRAKRERATAVARAVADGGERVIAQLERAVAQAAQERTEVESARAQADTELAQLRSRTRRLSSELAELTSSVHRDEVARAEQRLRIEALENRAMAEFGIEADVLVNEYGPQQPVPPSLRAPGDEIDPAAPQPQPYPYVRAEQERRLKTAQKALALLGKVNPLALEEFAALEERHKFLTEQLDDLKRSRKDLLDLIGDVDKRVEEVFTQAYADTAEQFTAVFARLFPGGAGRLILTDPDSMLTSGVDVEARPPGKKVKRLSLLSGGERSLTAVAFLVALFKARPSPFYVLDEVEAALDDTNLGRLLDVIEELRADSQLIVITHQKRTMEVADALYGVAMRGDGVTHVISQRLREPA